MSATFWNAYFDETRSLGFFPAAQDELEILLDVHLLNRAISELIDAFDNRPSWIGVALHSLLHLLGDSEQVNQEPTSRRLNHLGER